MASGNGRMGSRREQTKNIIKLLNMKLLKCISGVIVTISILAHIILHIVKKNDNCHLLLHHGYLRSPKEWQSTGCMMHSYSENNINDCLRYKNFLHERTFLTFVGDSRIRQLAKQIISATTKKVKYPTKKWSNFQVSNEEMNTYYDFFWSPYLEDDVEIYRNIAIDFLKEKDYESFKKKYINSTERKKFNERHLSFGDKSIVRKHYLISSTCLWYVQNDNSSYVRMKINMKNFVNIIYNILLSPERIVFKKELINYSRKHLSSTENLLLKKNRDRLKVLIPLQPKVDELRIRGNVEINNLKKNKLRLRNKEIGKCNDIIRDIISSTKQTNQSIIDNDNLFDIWSSMPDTVEMSKKSNVGNDDGFHLTHIQLNISSQIFYNYICNDQMNFPDATCCSNSINIDSIQVISICFLGLCCIVYLIQILQNVRFISNFFQRLHLCLYSIFINPLKLSLVKCMKYLHLYNLFVDKSNGESLVNDGRDSDDSSQIFFFTLMKISLMMLYFLLCDRFNLFMKENKIYSLTSFLAPTIYFLVLGIFMSKKITTGTILNRFQTDEWKGWMQLIILIYHYFGASRNIQIYMYLRIIVTMYIFMSGYGHFSYYFKKGVYQLTRFVQVLFRMNFLTILLCFVMGQSYQSYYFVPLITFWYLVLFAVMAIPPWINETNTRERPWLYFVMYLKIFILIIVMEVFFRNKLAFDSFFLQPPWKDLFVSADDSVHEWWFRWWLDRFSLAGGMLLSLTLHILQRYSIIAIPSPNGDIHTKKPLKKMLGILCTMVCIGILIFHVVFVSKQTVKSQANYHQAYFGVIIITAFVYLRNLQYLSIRNYYSVFFANVGKISLELFICQYHIWLAADTKGILVLIPGAHVLNLVVTTTVFVAISHEINVCTNALLPILVPNDWKLIIRNFVLFSLAFIPVFIKYGYF
ncbi:hypothetical protein SNEBB_000417 [Seison nebaliae]|nr:hypothetical protein SNEBB_000417 [Seison nebaliae]